MATGTEKTWSYQVDPVLVNLVREAENLGADESLAPNQGFINLILTVGGVLVAGELIAKDNWFDQQFGPAESAEPVIREHSVAGDSSEDSRVPSPQTEEADEDERKYIHLRNAKFYQSGNVIPGEGSGFFWRGRLAAVDGFMLGSLEVISRKPNPHTIAINGARIRIE